MNTGLKVAITSSVEQMATHDSTRSIHSAGIDAYRQNRKGLLRSYLFDVWKKFKFVLGLGSYARGAKQLEMDECCMRT